MEGEVLRGGGIGGAYRHRSHSHVLDHLWTSRELDGHLYIPHVSTIFIFHQLLLGLSHNLVLNITSIRNKVKIFISITRVSFR